MYTPTFRLYGSGSVIGLSSRMCRLRVDWRGLTTTRLVSVVIFSFAEYLAMAGLCWVIMASLLWNSLIVRKSATERICRLGASSILFAIVL